jgi:hypothetical protein
MAGHLSELVAEAWLKSVTRWSQAGRRKIEFGASTEEDALPDAVATSAPPTA